MYDFFFGTVASCSPTTAVLEVGGVGYRFEIPVSTYEAVRSAANASRAVKLYAHLLVKEDDLRLFGFAEEADRRLFEALITVKGVGPRIGLAVLSGSSTADVVRAIGVGDTGLLDRIKGIGRKTAERVVVELREKAHLLMPPAEAITRLSSEADDAVRALVSLGYNPAAARKAIDKAAQVLGPDVAVEELVREGLQHTR
ncbi:Holliday junction branch migration protein RuvA [Planctomycetota bacterium]